jgi:hypothetical protein
LGGATRYLAYFLLMMPPVINVCVSRTNAALLGKGLPGMDFGELLQVIGIIFALGLQNPRRRRAAWILDGNKIWTSPQFGRRFGISVHRFEKNIGNWLWCPDAAPWNDVYDRLRRVRYFQQDFNEHISKVFVPGTAFCCDESTTKWIGFDDWHPDGCPHITKNPHKPNNVESRGLNSCLC